MRIFECRDKAGNVCAKAATREKAVPFWNTRGNARLVDDLGEAIHKSTTSITGLDRWHTAGLAY